MNHAQVKKVNKQLSGAHDSYVAVRKIEKNLTN